MDLAIKVLPALLEGVKTTITLFGLTLIISLPLGMVIGLISSTKLVLVKG